MEICGEYLEQLMDRDLFDYLHAHYCHFFPRFRDCTWCVR